MRRVIRTFTTGSAASWKGSWACPDPSSIIEPSIVVA
jgi:hypothetical protein